MTVRFSPEIIGDLRRLAVDHNGVAQPQFHVKLTKLKKLYGSFLSAGGHAGALMKIENHLRDLRQGLNKARRPPRGRRGEPFDPAEHPRGRGGQFATTGGHAVQVGGPVNAPITVGQGHPIQVIPETRYSTFGPPIAGAAGIAAGGIAGFTTTTLTGSPIDRLATAGLGRLGSLGGDLGGYAVGHGVGGAKTASRAAARAIHQTTGVRIPTPGPFTQGQLRRARTIGQQVGHYVGTKAGETVAVISNAPIVGAHTLAGRLGVREFGRRGAGALAGAVITGGMFYAPIAYHAMQRVGPYFDTAFPRRVEKADGSVVSEAEVLAKLEELWADEELAKASITPFRLVARALGTHGINVIRSAVTPAIRGARRFSSRFRASGAPTARAARPVREHPSSTEVFQAGMAGHPDPLASRPIGRAFDIAGRAVPLTIAGAGVGAISGAALQHFNLLHPRDAKGRFSHKSQAAISGAKVGSAVGLGFGLLGGLAAARRGQGGLLRTAIQRLGAAAEQMTQDTEKHAHTAHAGQYLASRPGKAKNLNLSPGSVPTREAVISALQQKGKQDWMNRIGAAMGSARSWYEFHIEDQFEKAVRAAKLPLQNSAGEAISPHSINLTQHVDPSKFPDDVARDKWNALVKLRQDSLDALNTQVTARTVAKEAAESAHTALKEENTKLINAISFNKQRVAELVKPGSTQRDIQAFARTRLGLPNGVPGADIAEMRENLKGLHAEWEAGATQRAGELPDEIKLARQAEEHAKNAETDKDLTETERQAVPNLFTTSQTDRFYPGVPDNVMAEAAKAGDAEAADFIRESDQYARRAIAHLNDLITGQQAAYAAAIPGKRLSRRLFEAAAPTLSGWVMRGVREQRELSGARRADLTGMWKDIDTYLRTSFSSRQAAKDALKNIHAQSMKYGSKAGAMAWKHWASISTGIGLLGGVGAIDINAEKGKRVKVNPKKWKLPRPIKVEQHTYTNLQSKAGPTVVTGLSFYNKDAKEQQFVHGWLIPSTGPKDRQPLAYGTSVESVKQQAREMAKGKSPGGKPLEVSKEVTDKIAELRGSGNIHQVGPVESPYERRVGGSPGNTENEAYNSFFKDHLSWTNKRGFSTNRVDAYWQSLHDLFLDPAMVVLDKNRTMHLLVGTKDKRGIFANRGDVLTNPNADKAAIVTELNRQIHSEQSSTLQPNTREHWHSLDRAVHLIGELKGLSDAQIATVMERATKDLENSGTPVPTETRQPKESADYFEEHFNNFTSVVPARVRKDAYKNDAAAKQFMQHMWEKAWAESEQNAPGKSNAVIAAMTRDAVNTKQIKGWIDLQATDPQTQNKVDVDDILELLGTKLRKLAPDLGLRKYLTNEPAKPRQPRAPKIGGSSKPPSVTGSYLRQEAHPAQALGQLSTYGLGQAGYASAKFLSHAAFGGTGVIPKIARFGMTTLGGLVGGVGGQMAGQHLGRKIAGSPGPQIPENELLGRTIAGVGGTMAGTDLSRKFGINRVVARGVGRAAGAAGRRVASSAAGTAISGAAGRLGRTAVATAGKSALSRLGSTAVGAATKGIGQRIGASIGGAFGRAAGALGGTAIEPGGGTALGAAGGWAAGEAIGAGVGYLADEGVGLLYHHLSRYGDHVPHMAAKTLGHKPRVVQAVST